jgi:hypothetical protein
MKRYYEGLKKDNVGDDDDVKHTEHEEFPNLHKISCDRLKDLRIEEIIDYKDNFVIFEVVNKKTFNIDYYKYDCRLDLLHQLAEYEIKLFVKNNVEYNNRMKYTLSGYGRYNFNNERYSFALRNDIICHRIHQSKSISRGYDVSHIPQKRRKVDFEMRYPSVDLKSHYYDVKTEYIYDHNKNKQLRVSKKIFGDIDVKYIEITFIYDTILIIFRKGYDRKLSYLSVYSKWDHTLAYRFEDQSYHKTMTLSLLCNRRKDKLLRLPKYVLLHIFSLL